MNMLSRLYRKYRKPSGVIAKERLRLVLTHDRAGIPPELLRVMKNEIITIISKHVRVDREGIEVNLSHQRGRTTLVANIPIVNPRRNPFSDQM